jgi:hypothetical protein
MLKTSYRFICETTVVIAGLTLLFGCGIVRGIKSSSGSTPSSTVTGPVTPGITYASNSINFLSVSNGQFVEATSGIPVVTGGVITNCTIAFTSGPMPQSPPQINTSTCEISGFRDSGYGSCGPIHDRSTGTNYTITPYINGQAATSVELLLYITADDTGPC